MAVTTTTSVMTMLKCVPHTSTPSLLSPTRNGSGQNRNASDLLGHEARSRPMTHMFTSSNVPVRTSYQSKQMLDVDQVNTNIVSTPPPPPLLSSFATGTVELGFGLAARSSPSSSSGHEGGSGARVDRWRAVDR